MRLSSVTCDRCGVEKSGKVKIENYRVSFGWSGYVSDASHRCDLCERCKAIVSAAFSAVAASSLTIIKEDVDGN